MPTIKPSVSYSYKDINGEEVSLTDEEKQAALHEALKNKIFSRNQHIYAEKIREESKPRKYDAAEFGEIILGNNPDFLLDDQVNDIFLLLCRYFTNDPDFEQDGRSLKKGILLFGPVGCGKTTILRIFQSNPANNYRLLSCRQVADEYAAKTGGTTTIDRYSNVIPITPSLNNGQTFAGFCFDDLGTECVKKHFGSEINVMENIILNRYDNQIKNKTHFTTNLTPDQIEHYYGLRVRDRLKELCNVIEFENAVSRRK